MTIQNMCLVKNKKTAIALKVVFEENNSKRMFYFLLVVIKNSLVSYTGVQCGHGVRIWNS